MNDSEKYPVRVAEVDDIPERLKAGRGPANRGVGKWEWLRQMITHEMAPEAKSSLTSLSTRLLEFPNKKTMSQAQSACQGCSPKNKSRSSVATKIKEAGFSIITRSDPKDGHKDGAYNLYVQVIYENDQGVVE